MSRILRLFAVVVLAGFPALALARPPLIYHHTMNMPAQSGADVRLMLGSQDAQITVKPVKSVAVTVDIWADASSANDKAKVIERLAPTTSMQGNDVLIRSSENHGSFWSFGWNRTETLVSVVMPPDMNVVYRLGSGDFHFDNADAPTVIAGESGSGDSFVNSASKRLNLKSGSGDLKVHITGTSNSVGLHAGSGDVGFTGATGLLKLNSDSGDITVMNATAKSASLDSDSGDIEAHWQKLAAGASITGDSDSGDVTMYFPAGTVIGGSISTDSGDVTTDFPATIHGSHQSYTLAGGAGAIQVELDTDSGDATLRKGG